MGPILDLGTRLSTIVLLRASDAAVEHLVRTCIPAVSGRLSERLVDLLDGAGTTSRQALV